MKFTAPDPITLKTVREWVRLNTGIEIPDGKEYLVITRLSPLLENYNIRNLIDLCNRAQFSPSIKDKIIDAISTNETLFFRDPNCFELYTYKLIPDFLDRTEGRNIPLKILSAGCSSGQEVYSLIMATAENHPDLLTNNFSVLGCDISDAAIKTAQDGLYSPLKVSRGLDEKTLRKYFDEENLRWKISSMIRKHASFRKANLLQPARHLGKFHMIFCRYLSCYLNEENQRILFKNLIDLLDKNGTLILGGTEILPPGEKSLIKHFKYRYTYYELA